MKTELSPLKSSDFSFGKVMCHNTQESLLRKETSSLNDLIKQVRALQGSRQKPLRNDIN